MLCVSCRLCRGQAMRGTMLLMKEGMFAVCVARLTRCGWRLGIIAAFLFRSWMKDFSLNHS